MVNIRMGASLHDALTARAKMEGTADTSAARAILAAALASDPADAPRIARAAPPYALPPEAAMELRQAREAAAEATGAAVQLAALARVSGMDEHHAALERIIPMLRRAAIEFLDLSDEIIRDHRQHVREAAG